jgi:type III restriction enzyme
VQARTATRLTLGLELLSGSAMATTDAGVDNGPGLDRARIVRAVSDLAPGPWRAWAWLADAETALRQRGIAEAAIAGSAMSLIEALRLGIERETDRLAEERFTALLAQGRIEFSLRADKADYELPADFELLVSAAAQAWMRPDGLAPMQRTLYEPALRTADINEFEYRVAGWLDEQQAVRWWHRNVARTQYGLQGWKRHKVYPDFVFAVHKADGGTRTVLLETKGLHLKNEDSAYKQALLQRLSAAFRDQRHASVGSLGLVSNTADDVQCDLVFQDGWQGALNARWFNPG